MVYTARSFEELKERKPLKRAHDIQYENVVSYVTFSAANDHAQARRQLNWNGGGHGSQYIVLSELLSDQAAFITSPKTSLANYWGGAFPPCPPSVYGSVMRKNIR